MAPISFLLKIQEPLVRDCAWFSMKPKKSDGEEEEEEISKAGRKMKTCRGEVTLTAALLYLFATTQLT